MIKNEIKPAFYLARLVIFYKSKKYDENFQTCFFKCQVYLQSICSK
jgi:hypothetical protein